MKLKFLLFAFLFSCGITYAQNDTIKTLIFTEFSSGGDVDWHWEITNVGDKPIQMGDFKLAKLSPYVDFNVNDVYQDEWGPNNAYFFFPERLLQPGESFTCTGAVDFGPAQYKNMGSLFMPVELLFVISKLNGADFSIFHLKRD